MDEMKSQVQEQQQPQESFRVMGIEEANPIYSKSVTQEPNIQLKIIEMARQIYLPYYRPFKLWFKKEEDQQQEILDGNERALPNSSFVQYYAKEQFVYQRYDNSQFNTCKDVTHFTGSFLPLGIFVNHMRPAQDTYSPIDIAKNYYETSKINIVNNDNNNLIFDSNFESGNLFAAIKISTFQYDLLMQNDTNNQCGNNQWFYFSLENIISSVQYTINIVNFTKNDSLFNYGMTPVGYSVGMNKANGSQWFNIGKNVIYKKSTVRKQNSKKYYYKLSFKLKWNMHNDKLYIAYTYPYTYTKLCTKLQLVLSKNKQIVTKTVIGETLNKRNIIALIMSRIKKTKKDNRKAIVIMARQHPGETQGSHVCQGLIDKLLQKQKQSQFLLKNYIIYVIPMVNPDGVSFGHYRTNLAGKDLNRKWDTIQKQLSCPQIIAIKNYIYSISKQRQIRFILDLHGHSKKQNSFFYGNSCPQHPQLVRIYPYICSRNHQGVQYFDCTFATEQSKKKTARIYLSSIYKQIQVYTYQVSFHAYFKQGVKINFNPKQFRQLGQNLVNSLSIMLEADNKNDNKYQHKDRQLLFDKYMGELRQNPKLLEVGNQIQSGSQSNPEQGQINMTIISQNEQTKKKITQQSMEQKSKVTVRLGSRKNGRQIKQMKEYVRPGRNIRFLEISRVNSVVPDKYRLGLQPMSKLGLMQNHEFTTMKQSIILSVNSSSQTDGRQHEQFKSYSIQDLQGCGELSGSIQIPKKNNSQKRYSSLLKNTKNQNNIIFRIDFNHQRCTSSKYHIRQISRLYYAYTQTIISFKKQKNDQIKSSQLFPFVDDGNNQKIFKKYQIKFDGGKANLKKNQDVLITGMVKKYLMEKQTKEKQEENTIRERPLSIKRKQIIYRKI